VTHYHLNAEPLVMGAKVRQEGSLDCLCCGKEFIPRSSEPGELICQECQQMYEVEVVGPRSVRVSHKHR
jgi:hypothetical protein